jgi:hypothetical protein
MNKCRYNPACYTLSAILALSTFFISCTPVQIPPALLPTQVSATLPVTQDEPFTIVALPDTQWYSEFYPATFTAQTQWIQNNTISKNIVFTVHLGDLVESQHDHNELVTEQWRNAKKAMDLLNGLKYSVLPGNHDNCNFATNEINNTFFNSVFPYTEFKKYPWYSGHYPQNGNENSYSLVDISCQKLLILNIGYFGDISEPTDELLKVFAWANAAIAQYPERSVIVVTHALIGNDGGFLRPGRLLWDQVLKKHRNIFLALCGHACTESTITQTGESGNVVNILLSDYQCDENGGNGYLRVMKFIPSKSIIHVETFSPLTNALRPNSASFDIPYTYKYQCPSVITSAATDISVTTATLNGTAIIPLLPAKNLTPLKGELIDASLNNMVSFNASFEYGTGSGDYTSQTSPVALHGSGRFQMSVSGLRPYTTYYVRAILTIPQVNPQTYALNRVIQGAGIGIDDRSIFNLFNIPVILARPSTIYGNEISFTTIGLTGPTSHGTGGGQIGSPAPPTNMANIIVQSATIATTQVAPGEKVNVAATVTNTGGSNGAAKITLYVNGQEAESRGVTLSSGQTAPVSFSISRNEPGTYTVYVNGVPAGSFVVDMFTNNDVLIYSIIALFTLGIIGVLYMVVKRRGA